MSEIKRTFGDEGPDNADRAEWAEQVVSIFCEVTGLNPKLEMREALSDLIANLGHYCDSHNIDFLRIASEAIGVWDAEKREEENGEPNALYPEKKVLITLFERPN